MILLRFKPLFLKYIFLFVVLALQSFFAVAQQVRFNVFTTEDRSHPLPNSTVWDIDQDTKGRMWFSIIGSGLVLYDGVDFISFGEDEGYPELSTTLAIERGFDNDLWVFSYGQVYRVSLPESNLLKVDSLIVQSSITGKNGQLDLYKGFTMANGEEAFVVDTVRKQVWVATAQVGLVRYSKLGSGFWTADTLLPSQLDPKSKRNSEDIRAIWLRKNQELIVSTASGDLYSLNPDIAYSRVEPIQEIPQRFAAPFLEEGTAWVNALYEDSQERLWASSTNGIVWFLESPLKDIQPIDLPLIAKNLAQVGTAIQEIKSDVNGNVWLGTDVGPIRVSPDTKQIYKPVGVDGSATLSLYLDNQGSLWAGSYQALYQFPQNYTQFQFFDLKPLGLSSSEVLSISSAKTNHELYLGTSQGFIKADLDQPQDSWILVDERDGLSSNSVFDSYVDKKGNVWLATLRGITVFASKQNDEVLKRQVKEIKKTKLGWLKSIKARSTFLAIKSIQIGGEELLLFPGYNGMGMIFRNSFYTFSNPVNKQGIAFNDVIGLEGYWLLGAENGGLYRSRIKLTKELITELTQSAKKNVHGFFEIQQTIFDELPLEKQLQGVAINDFEWFTDSLFLAKTDAGLAVFDAVSIQNSLTDTVFAKQLINKSKGLPIDSFTALEFDKVNQVVYLFSNKGIGKYDIKNGVLMDWHDRTDGLHDEFTWRKSGAMFKNGKAFSGTGKGLVVTEFPEKEKKVEPNIVLYDFTYNEDMNGNNRLELELRNLDYSTESKLDYWYKIEPYTQDWIQSNRYDITYTNLPAYFFDKTYTVLVANQNSGNQKILVKKVFSVSPAWYQTWWFVLLFLSVFSFTIVTIYRKKMEKIQKEENELAERKQFETVQKIGSSIAHDLKNSIFSLSLLSSNLEKRFDNPSFRKDAIETLDSSLEHMKSLVMRLQQKQDNWQIDKQAKDVSKTIADTLKRMQLEQFEKIVIHKNINESLLFAHDEHAIQRVLENIVLNALDAMNHKGELSIRAFKTESGIQIDIQDSGTGMSAAFIKNKLFKPFLTTKEKGIGLGLYTCREIIKAHGGQIQVESEQGAGTTFSILL
ncbi:hypothetical protein EP331_14275 [bacterium]|nr:MAG: hypothetical protein EP331_14275 [bacterium]